MGRIYNYIFNASFGSGVNNNKSFFVDWDRLPDNKSFKLTFTFSTLQTNNLFTQLPNLYCNLGQNYDILVNSNGDNLRGGYLGFLQPIGFSTGAGVTTYTGFMANTTTNPPIFLDRRPQNTQVTIEIKSSTSTNTAYLTSLSDYTLVLSFEELE